MIARFVKPDRDESFGGKWKFCWLPTACYWYEPGDTRFGHPSPGKLVKLKKKRWFQWVWVEYNVFMGYIVIEGEGRYVRQES